MALARKVSGFRGGARLQSRIPEVIAELPGRSTALATALAEETAALAKDRAPVGETGELRDSLEGKTLDRGDAAVMAAWYFFFLEFGTTKAPAQPFLLPAFEQAVSRLSDIGREVLDDL